MNDDLSDISMPAIKEPRVEPIVLAKLIEHIAWQLHRLFHHNTVVVLHLTLAKDLWYRHLRLVGQQRCSGNAPASNMYRRRRWRRTV
jgi:hypothetical protein